MGVGRQAFNPINRDYVSLEGTRRFEAPEADRGLLGNTLSDPVVEEALGLTSELGIPVYLNRYLKRANSIEEYASDLGNIFQDERFAGFDVYEFAHVSRPTPDASKLELVENRLERIRAKSRGARDSLVKRSHTRNL